MTVEPWPILPRTDARRTLSAMVQPMLTPDNRICLTHGLIRDPGHREQRVRISILTPQGKVSALANFEDLRPLPGTKPFLIRNARNPIASFDLETVAPPSAPRDGYALFAGPDSIIPRQSVKDIVAPPPPPSGWKPGDPLKGPLPPPPPPSGWKPGDPLKGPLPPPPPEPKAIPAFLRDYPRNPEGPKLQPYSPALVTLYLAVLSGIGRIVDQICMARLQAGIREHAAHIDRRQERHLKAWEALAVARRTIPPLQD
jgi:hypothetical protein